MRPPAPCATTKGSATNANERTSTMALSFLDFIERSLPNLDCEARESESVAGRALFASSIIRCCQHRPSRGILFSQSMSVQSHTRTRLLRRMGEAIADFQMIEDGDRL